MSRQFTLTFNPARVEIEHDERTGFDRVTYPRLMAYQPADWVGAPSLPAVQRHLLLPEGFRVASLEVDLSDPVLIPGETRPYPIEDGWGGPTVPDPVYYEEGTLFPPVTYRVQANSAYRSFRMGEIMVMPFEYLGSAQALRLYRRAEITVRFEPVPADAGLPVRLRPDRQLSRGRYELDWIRGHVFNPEDVDGFYPLHGPQDKTVISDTTQSTGFHPTDKPSILGPPVDMVIITGTEWTDGYDLAGDMTVPFQRLADWRTQSGIPTVVRTVQWIRENYEGVDDQTRIRAFLKDSYSKWGTDFAILGGSVEVVPARIVLTSDYYGGGYLYAEDMPSDYYYVGLDGDWNSDQDAYYEESEIYNTIDQYPDLWVGRIPARDSLEAHQIIEKILAYERIPDYTGSVPADSYYTKALLAAGLTNSGKWDWSNGIYGAERLKAVVLETAGFTCTRLYPSLADSADCGGATLECYYEIKDNFLSYPPDGENEILSGWQMRRHLEQDKASIFFHWEHSSYEQLGGPWLEFHGNLNPGKEGCEEDHSSECSNCAQWDSLCYAAYRAANTHGGLPREVALDLQNGPEYFVGLSYGSHTGRFEVDGISENLLRAPDGGAVAFFSKVTSITTGGTPGLDSTFVQLQTFEYLLRQRKPTGVSLQNAILDYPSTSAFARLIWHCFGDPTMQVWSDVPGSLTVSSNPTDLGEPGIRRFEISVSDGATPVEGARVTLFRENDVYALGQTNASGQAVFQSIQLNNIGDDLDVVCTSPNFLPKRLQIPPPTTTNPFGREAPLVYVGHQFSDSLRCGPTEGVIDAGDRVSVDVVVKNLGYRASHPGDAWLFPTPRVKGTARIDDLFDASKIYLGKHKSNPPAFADTFCLIANEYGIRPEIQPTMTYDSAWYLWRDEDARYHARAVYGAGDTGVSYDALFIADGGLSVVDSSGTETGDDWGISSDGDSLWISFTGDGSDDELIWRAEAADWISTIVDSVACDSVLASGLDTLSFRFDVLPNVPPRTRLDFSVATQGSDYPYPIFSDFYLDIHAPDISLGVIEDAVVDSFRYEDPLYSCTPGDTLFCFSVWVRNDGDGAADSVRCYADLDGANVTPQVSTLWFDLDPGEETTGDTPILFCDEGKTCTVDTLDLTNWIHGDSFAIEIVEDIDPWPIQDPDYLTEDLTVYPEKQGMRLTWTEPPEMTDVWGYSIWVESDDVQERRMLVPKDDVRHVHVHEVPYNDAGDAIAYRFGVATVLDNHKETTPAWSGWEHPNLDERDGWPKKTPKGMAHSVALIDLDDDGTLEVVSAGRVLAAWHEDGSSATSSNDGLLFDPDPTQHTEMNRFFCGDLAAGDLSGDGDIEFAGIFGYDSLFVVSEDGSVDWKKAVEARSTVTLADLDGNDSLEVIVSSWREGMIYVYEEDGSAYHSSGEVFVDHDDAAKSYSQSGVAVGKFGEDDVLSIVQTTRTGEIYVWEGTKGPQAPTEWSYNLSSFPLSSPTLADFDGDGTVDVIACGKVSDDVSRVWVVSVADSLILASWDFYKNQFDADFPQTPIALELGNEGSREVVVGRKTKIKTVPYTLDPMAKAMILYESDSQAVMDSCVADIPLPGRRGSKYSETIGSPLVANIDGDDNLEILIGSNQGGLFAWDVSWNDVAETWTTTAESGWPIVLPDLIPNVAVGDLDDDGFLELVVPMHDGYVHTYDLAGLSTGSEPWPMAGHDVRRTGNEEGGGTGQPRIIPETLLPHESGLDLAGRNPSSDGIALRFRVPSRSRVEIGIYDVTGRLVRSLVPAGEIDRGIYAQHWDGRSDEGRAASSGVYFIRADIGNSRMTKKVVLTR